MGLSTESPIFLELDLTSTSTRKGLARKYAQEEFLLLQRGNLVSCPDLENGLNCHTMSKQNLMGFTLPQMESIMVGMGEKPFKGKQLFKWLYNTRQYDFNLMTNLRRELRERLAQA